jgi:hypothetical protein
MGQLDSGSFGHWDLPDIRHVAIVLIQVSEVLDRTRSPSRYAYAGFGCDLVTFVQLASC